MAVVVIDGSTLRAFVDDETEFTKSVIERFTVLDLNNDRILSNPVLRKTFDSFRLIETHFGGDESMTAEEFKNEMRKIMLAIADGLRSNPIQMAFEDDDGCSFLNQAAR